MIRGNRILRWPVLLIVILCAGLLSQWLRGTGPAAVPSVNLGGVVNNASYALVSLNVAPGTIAAVFGSELTDGTSCLSAAGCFPSFDGAGRLGTSMSGAQVTVNGIPVPIFYATPTQLGIQIPTDLPGTSASIRVTVGSQTSAPRDISIDPFAPGLFTVSQDGRGAGAITHADGSLVDASNPARPEEAVIIYATGLGQVTPAVPTGTLPRGTTTTLATPTVTIDGIPVQVQFSGLSGCCVGLNQINAVVPANVHMASNIPVLLSIGGRQSNVVTIATAATTPLTATPGSINFGDVPVDTTSTRSLTLINTGNTSLTISQASVSGPGFAVDLRLPLTLGVGQSANFSVTFRPTAPGSASGIISITSDVLNSVVPLSGNATSTPSRPTITTNSLPNGRQSTPYNATLVAAGGQTPYSWAISAGSLPAGLTLAASTGLISGTPTSTGTSTFTAQVTDASSQTATTALSITINAPNVPLVTTTSLPNGTQNKSYSASVEATGGTTPYSWAISAGSLPAGLTLAASTGLISGTPTSIGTSTFTVQVTDANSQASTAPLSITVVPDAPLSITTNSLPDGRQNTPYNATLVATGGQTPYSWTISAGSLPAGLTLAASTGLISGTPTASGTSSFTVQVTDANSQTATKALSIAVVPATALSITTTSLPDGRQSTPYNATLVATGGQTPYSWTISAGSLPAGLTLAASTGLISGTPTASGTSSFTVQVTDANSQAATKALSITVYLPLSITTDSLPNGAATVAYNTTLVAAGGKTPYSWSVIAGTLPTGLTLAASTGVISGVPTAGGTFNFTVRVTEANSETATKALSITITISTSTPSVSLTWTASTSVVAGYNVYRGTVSGGPFTKLNSTPITGTAYTDITILRGQTYIYAVTAVNSSGVESLFSNEATAVVPP